MTNRLLGAAAVAVAVAAVVTLPRADADILVFADGFVIEGKLSQKMTWLANPGGPSISVPKQGEPFWIDDGVRKIIFSPGQLKEALQDKSKKAAPDQVFKLQSPNPAGDLPLSWVIDSATDWDSRWERELTLKTPQGGKFKVRQRIIVLTPDYIGIDATAFKWPCYYNTRELDPQTLRGLLHKYLSKKSEKDLDLRVKIHRFLLQAGFTAAAEQELDDMLRDYPKEQSRIAPLKDHMQRLHAAELVQDLERSQKAGLFDDVEQKLNLYAQRKLDDLLEETAQLRVQAIKDKHEAAKKKLTDAGRLVRAFAEIVPPSKREFFQNAAAAIVEELNPDTVDRLDTFLNLAADYERAIKDKRQPEHSAAEVMAFALTGWLRGSDAAERDPNVAVQQWQVRKLLLDYLKTDDPLVRKNRLLPALRAAKVSVDEAMQIIRRLPPVDPFETVSAKPQTLQTKNDGKQFSYELQLPPGYNHGRAWPVLIALHHFEEKASGALARWTALAAQHGYIVAAPEWGKGPKSVYQFSAQEHNAVLETLRDLRRRFQIDSDRVFLFGCEQGGIMAFDVGLAHPDQFTGVVPMAAPPLFFARRYWPNAQYLHLYIINGERASWSGQETQSMLTQAMVKDFIRGNYPAVYVEYKGRPADWFGAEPAIVFDWMNRKRRAHPLKELGRQGEEFRTQRSTDNQFYWLSTASVQPQHLNTAAGWNANSKSATMRATVFSTNEIHVKTSGVGRVTLWFPPKLVNYGDKVSIRVNDAAAVKALVTPNLDTLMETLYQTADRQRLYFARLEL